LFKFKAKIMEISIVKRVRLENANNDKIDKNFLYTIPEWENFRSYDERAILYSKNYKEIFNKEFKEDNYKDSKRGIVKISCENATNKKKKVIYRLFVAKPLDSSTIGLTSQSLNELGIKEGEHRIYISKANNLFGRYLFYKDHPFHEVRFPIKLAYFFGLISILLGLLSFIIAMIQFFK
jgi:hypothetical protein